MLKFLIIVDQGSLEGYWYSSSQVQMNQYHWFLSFTLSRTRYIVQLVLGPGYTIVSFSCPWATSSLVFLHQLEVLLACEPGNYKGLVQNKLWADTGSQPLSSSFSVKTHYTWSLLLLSTNQYFWSSSAGSFSIPPTSLSCGQNHFRSTGNHSGTCYKCPSAEHTLKSNFQLCLYESEMPEPLQNSEIPKPFQKSEIPKPFQFSLFR